LQDSKGFCKILKDFARFCKILQNLLTFGKDTSTSCQQFESRNSQDSTRFCRILHNSEGFCKILKDFARFGKILQNLLTFGQDTTTSCHCKQFKSRNLQDSTNICRILQDSTKSPDFWARYNNKLSLQTV